METIDTVINSIIIRKISDLNKAFKIPKIIFQHHHIVLMRKLYLMKSRLHLKSYIRKMVFFFFFIIIKLTFIIILHLTYYNATSK